MMKCFRVDLWNQLAAYVDGELDNRTVRRVENHLLACNACRLRLARLRDGQRFAMQLPLEAATTDNWEAIAAALDAESVAPRVPVSAKRFPNWRQIFASPLFAITILAIALLVFGWSFFINKPAPKAPTILAHSFDASSFRPVSIGNIQNNTEPHVVAEGYVTEVRLDEEDGDLMFKLVDDLSQPSPFIICEIISPINLAPPVVGSRVKVYGVSRYDADEGRHWHEVHPVLALEKVHD